MAAWTRCRRLFFWQSLRYSQTSWTSGKRWHGRYAALIGEAFGDGAAGPEVRLPHVWSPTTARCSLNIRLKCPTRRRCDRACGRGAFRLRFITRCRCICNPRFATQKSATPVSGCRRRGSTGNKPANAPVSYRSRASPRGVGVARRGERRPAGMMVGDAGIEPATSPV